jgi:hypothetical protein
MGFHGIKLDLAGFQGFNMLSWNSLGFNLIQNQNSWVSMGFNGHHGIFIEI